MHVGHARLCVCLSAAACPHYCTDPDVTWGMVGDSPIPIVVHAQLGGFAIGARVALLWQHSANAKCQRVLCLYSLYAWFHLCGCKQVKLRCSPGCAILRHIIRVHNLWDSLMSPHASVHATNQTGSDRPRSLQHMVHLYKRYYKCYEYKMLNLYMPVSHV